MQIYLSQNGTHTGPFPLEEVQKMVASGKRSLNDAAWHQGLANWVPLSAIIGENKSSVPPPLPHFPPPVGGHPSGWRHRAETVFVNVTGEITTVAGVGKIEGLSGREFLSNVLKKRKDDEIEELFITGTRNATPLLKDIDTSWPKPWVFSKAMVMSLLIFGGFYYGSVGMDNSNMIPGAILVGSFAIPFSTLIFFIEMNVARNFSVYQILKLVFMGGLFSLLVALFLDSLIPAQSNSDGDLTWLGAGVTGLVEESAKVAAAIFFFGNRRFRWSLNGLLIGAAIGTGFSAFESAGYALNALLGNFRQMITDGGTGEWAQVVGGMIHSIEVRGLLSPFSHIVWAALSVAALWKVKGDLPFKFSMLFDWRFLRVFLIVAALHALWDSPLTIPVVSPETADVLKGIILGLIAWVAVFGYIQDGLKQIRVAQADEASMPPEASAAAATSAPSPA